MLEAFIFVKCSYKSIIWDEYMQYNGVLISLQLTFHEFNEYLEMT